MVFHVQCDDSLGRCMAVFAYLVMFAGNATYFLTVVWRFIGTESETDRIIEYVCYSTCWSLMLFSHIFTMCIDPGFIPKNYQYKDDNLTPPFSTIFEIKTAKLNKVRRPDAINGTEIDEESGAVDISRSRSVSAIGSELNSQLSKSSTLEAVLPKLRAEERAIAQSIEQSVKATGMSQREVKRVNMKMETHCNKCRSVKPPRSHHCSTCGHCVLKMDHHCPWMNNCIGLRNQKAFLLFNFYTMITSGWTLIRVGISAYDCKQDTGCEVFNTQLTIMTAIVMLLCIIFTLFCAIMFCDQARMIVQDTSTIDRMQARQNQVEVAKKAVDNQQPDPRIDNPKQTKSIKPVDMDRPCCCGQGASCSPFFWLPCTIWQDNSVEAQLHND